MLKSALIGAVLLVGIGTPFPAALAQLTSAQKHAVFDKCLQTCRNNQTKCNSASSNPQYINACNDIFLYCAKVCDSTSFR